jgi:hypothetical protein
VRAAPLTAWRRCWAATASTCRRVRGTKGIGQHQPRSRTEHIRPLPSLPYPQGSIWRRQGWAQLDELRRKLEVGQSYLPLSASIASSLFHTSLHSLLGGHGLAPLFSPSSRFRTCESCGTWFAAWVEEAAGGR